MSIACVKINRRRVVRFDPQLLQPITALAHRMGTARRDAKFMAGNLVASGKTVAFGRLKADEPRKRNRQARQVGYDRFARGISVKDQTQWRT